MGVDAVDERPAFTCERADFACVELFQDGDLVQDAFKVGMYKLLYHFDMCGIRSEAIANQERIAKNKAMLAAQAASGGGGSNPSQQSV